MFKKFLMTFIFALSIAIVSQLAVMNKISAADVFAINLSGADVYVCGIDYNANEKSDLGFTQYSIFAPFDNTFGVTEEEANRAFIAEIKFVKNGKVVDNRGIAWRFVEHDGMVYFLMLQNGQVIPGSKFGRLSIDEGARAIYQVAKKFMQIAEDEKEIEKMAAKGTSLMENGKFQEAINTFNSIIQKQPDNYVAYYGIGFCYQSMQKYSDAIKAFQKSISIEPSSTAYKWLGVSYSGLNDGNNAIKNLNEAISINPKDHEAYFYLAMVNINFKQDYIKAAQYCEKAIEIYPRKDFQYYRILGLCYLSSGNYSKAINAYSEAINLKPNDGELYASRAYTYEYLQEFAKAEKDYIMALKYDPNFQPAKDGLARVKQN